MKSLFEKMIGVKIPCDYGWDDDGIVRIGAKLDIAAYVAGGFGGKCVIFFHGNGETATTEKFLYDSLNEKGISVIAPDYRGYGLTCGEFSESGCFEAAHAAYDWLRNEKGVCVDDIIPLGYSLGSGVAVELAATEQVGGLILQAPYYSGRALLPHWIKKFGAPGKRPKGFIARLRAGFALRRAVKMEKSFATDSRLSRITCPVLIFHGDADTIIPPAHGRKVQTGLSSQKKELAIVPGGGHNNFQFFMGYENYIAKIAEFCGIAGRFAATGGAMTEDGNGTPVVDGEDSEGWCYDVEDEEVAPKAPVAVKGDWKTSDMPDRHEVFFIHRTIHTDQMRVLRRGHVPREMEDKWFWYMEGDTLFAHRSWTGFCIYRIDFSTVNYHKVIVNRNPDQHNGTSIEEDRETLTKLLDWWIRSPYDYYNEWLAETADTLKRANKYSGTEVARKSNSDGLMGGEDACRLRDRRKGLLWGLVVGDCLGSPIQFSGKNDHPWITEMVECPVFGLPPGYWTDDSSMAMCVMDSYMRRGGYDLKDIGNTFAKWFTEGYLSSIEGRAFDIGRATRAACLHIAYGHEYVYGQEDSQGNGSIMRFAPSYLIAQNESYPAKVMHEVSDLTHSSGKVREVVDKFARILDGHVAGRRTTEVSPYGTREEVNNSGWAVSTLDAALWAFNTTKTFEDGMVASVNLGGDSDSIGAVYGQIAGAFYGFDAIPKRWVRAVKTWESVDAMIDGFLDVLETNCGLRG